MHDPESTPAQDAELRVAQLLRTMRAAEYEIRTLTGGRPASPDDLPYRWRCREQAQGVDADLPAAILNALPAHTALIDPDGVILSVNDSWRRFAAANRMQSPGFGVGQNYLDICDRASGADCEEASSAAHQIRRVLQGDAEAVAVEYPCHSPTDQRWFTLRVAPLDDDHGRCAVVMHADITERMRALSDARTLAERFTATVESLRDGFFTLDRDWRFTYVNQEAERMLKRPRTELLGGLIWAHVSEATDTLRRAFEHALRDNVAVDVEMLYAPSGMWIDARAFPSEQGLAVYVRDTTRVREADAALHKSEERFRLLSSATSDAIWDWDLLTDALWWNDGFTTLFGHRCAEVDPTVRSWTDYIHPDDVTRVTDGIHRVIDQGGSNWTDDYRFRRRDGSYANVLDRGHIIRDDEGRAVRMLGGMTDRTDAYRSEEALRRQQTELRVLFDFLPAMIVFKDTKGGILRTNKRLADTIGKSIDEIEGRPSGEIFPQDAEKYYADDVEVIRSGLPRLGIVETVRDRDGKELPIQTDKVPVFDPDGTVAGIIVMAQDITTRIEAESLIRLSEQRYRSLVDATAAIVWETPASGEFERDQPRWAAFTGQSFEESRGWGWLDAVHPDDQAETARVWSAAVAGRAIYKVEHRLRGQDHTYRDMMVRAVPIQAADGTILQWIGVHTDISDLKRAEQALRASTAEFRALAEAMPQIVWFSGPDGGNAYLNQHWVVYTGLTQEEGLGAGWNKPFHPDDRQRAWDAWQHGWATGGSFSFESRMRRADGAYRWWLVRGVPMPDATGAVVRWCGTCTDIDDLKRAELEITRSNQALQVEIVERRRAEVAADAANRAKSQFLENMSHELRTPLNGVIGMTDLALMTDLGIEQREYLETVKSSGESLLRIVNDILDFSTIEARQVTADVIPFDLSDCLATTLEPLASQAQAKGLDLAWDVGPDVPMSVVGDPGRLRQVVTNLVGNAIKFTSEGELVVSVEAEARTDRDALLRFSVSDTGIGVSREQQESIFKPFVQADGSTTRKYGGTGLGLAISRSLVALLGGRMWLESEPGKGSTFRFTVPFNLHRTRERGTRVRRAHLRQLRDMPVLVIYDDSVSRRILRATLERWLMKPVLAESARSGIAALQAHLRAGTALPLVLLDAQLPDMDGFSVVAEIRKDSALNGVSVLLLTSTAQLGDEARCQALGIGACLMKPVSPADLMQAIVGVLANRSGASGRQQVLTRHAMREGRRTLRVLVIEESTLHQLIATRLLERRGHVVVIAADWADALAGLESDADGYDLILMAMQLAGIDVFKATAIIRSREDPSDPPVPIVAMTADPTTDEEQHCLAAGMDGYVSKPVRAQQLFAAMDRVLVTGNAPG